MPTPPLEPDVYVSAFSKYLQKHERALAAAGSAPAGRQVAASSLAWLNPSAPATAKTLHLDPHHLAFLLLRFEEAGLTESQLGPVDLPLEQPPTRPLSYVDILQHGGQLRPDRSDAISVFSSFSMGSSWFGGSSVMSKEELLRSARYIYSCVSCSQCCVRGVRLNSGRTVH